MSLTLIKPYVRLRLGEVDTGFKEWVDYFNLDNIPSNIYDKAFHVSIGDTSGGTLNALHQQLSTSITISLFFKGYRNVSENVDRGILLAENLIEQMHEPVDRLGSTLKNFKFLSMAINESFVTNDNLIIITQNYDVTLFTCAGG